MDVITLGTGSPLPSADRAGPATLVKAGGRISCSTPGAVLLLRLAAVGLDCPPC